jgi:uncharacterized protein YcaQ
MTVYPLSALCVLALHSQQLTTPNGAEPRPGLDSVYRVVDQLGAIQIDTLQMVARSHYLVMWSRLGTYDLTFFDRLSYDPEQRRLFEGWQHAACFIPLHEYRYQMPHQRRLREEGSPWFSEWIKKRKNRELLDQVRERIRVEGGLRTNHFEDPRSERGSWWDWKPAKIALEYLTHWGDLMIRERVNFQRVYDLTERVLPQWVDVTEPSREERDRFWIERGAKALGVSTLRHAGDYTWMKVSRSRPVAEQLLGEGILVPIRGRLANGEIADLVIHRDNLSLLDQAASGALKAERTTFLSPFDNLFWAVRRDEQFWNFHQSLEAYLPVSKRIYGYYCLPILNRDRLIGRFDPKLERAEGVLRLKALYLEPGIRASEQLVTDVAEAMRDFMRFHNAKDLVIENSQPKIFGKRLMKSL